MQDACGYSNKKVETTYMEYDSTKYLVFKIIWEEKW